MSEQPKYLIIQREIGLSEDRDLFAEDINDTVTDGYRVHTFTVTYEGDGKLGGVRYTALMSLKSDSKYENISNMKDVPPHEVDEHLAEGWVITDSYSKFIRMVRPLKQTMIKEEK